MSRKPSASSIWEQEQHLTWRVSLPNKLSEATSKLFNVTSINTSGTTIRAPKTSKYQYIHSCSVRHITLIAQLEKILSEEGVDSTALCAPNRGQVALNSRNHFLELAIFDDWEYDTFSAEWPDYWRALEAFAFIPSNVRWQLVSVVNQRPDTNLWEVTELDGPGAGSFHWVPRLQLYFPFENPYKFAERIRAAIERRREAENAIRFRFLCKHIFNDGYFAPGKVFEQSILRRSSAEVYGVFKKIYKEYHIALALGKHLNSNCTLAIKQPQFSPSKLHYCCMKTDRAYTIKGDHVGVNELLDSFRRRTLLSNKNVFHALRLVSHECEMVRKLPMFLVSVEKPISLDEYEKQNQIQTSRTMKYLRNTWIERSTMHLHRTLSRLGPGNYDIAVSQWKVYSVLKLKRLVEQVQYRMQNALRDHILASTAAYVDFLVNECDAVLAIEEGYSWDGNLIESPYEPKRAAVFYLTLNMGSEAPFYSTDPERFPRVLQDIMDTIVEETHYIHTIEPSLMQSLIFPGNLFLSSVGLLDAVIEDRRRKLLDYYNKSILPLRAYAARYAAYRELFFSDVKEFIEQVKAAEKPSSEIKEDIALQIRMRENLQHAVPLSIAIGPFLINVQPLREALIRKRRELTEALLKMLTEKLHQKTADMIADYNAINERMCEKPVSIEHIYDIREFMEGVPETVARMEDRMKGILYEYEILDGFLYNLPDADFQQRWSALGYPRAVLQQMVTVREFHESEVEKFRKQQFADESAFTASVDDVNAYIAKFTTLYDVAKVSEMSVEVRRLWKKLQELVDRGHTTNRRQELFEMPPISLNNLFELRHNFGAYRDLWTVAADYLKLEESWLGNPLASVNVDDVRCGLQQAHDSLKDLLPMFHDQPQLLTVVEHFIRVVEAFRPNLDVMELLKCPHLEAIHWGQLAKEAGIKGKLSVDVGFDVFLEHGIRSHMKSIRSIVEKAVEQRLEQEKRLAEADRIRKQEEEYRKGRAERRQQRTEI